jgi:hypothetical protein
VQYPWNIVYPVPGGNGRRYGDSGGSPNRARSRHRSWRGRSATDVVAVVVDDAAGAAEVVATAGMVVVLVGAAVAGGIHAPGAGTADPGSQAAINPAATSADPARRLIVITR